MRTYDQWKTTDDTDYGPDSDMFFCSTCDHWFHEDDVCACGCDVCGERYCYCDDNIDACNAYWEEQACLTSTSAPCC